jgi:hypothetical protein
MILYGYQDRAVWISRPNSAGFFFVGLDEERSLQRKVETRDELHARILDAAASMKKWEDRLRRATRDLRARIVKCIEVDGGIFEFLFWIVANL